MYFAVRLSSPAESSGTWLEGILGDAAEADGEVGAWVRLGPGEQPVELRVAVSYVGEQSAWANLDAEVGERSFEEVRDATRETWSELLSRVRVEGGSDADKTALYTALYHVLLHPNIFSDVDGRAPGMNGEVVSVDTPRYTVYSMWDSYRTVHPLLSLLYPERQREMLSSLAQLGAELGAPPQWELAASEVNIWSGIRPRRSSPTPCSAASTTSTSRRPISSCARRPSTPSPRAGPATPSTGLSAMSRWSSPPTPGVRSRPLSSMPTPTGPSPSSPPTSATTTTPRCSLTGAARLETP